MPLTLGPGEAHAFLRTNAAPAPHLDMLTAVGFRALGVALRMDVFETLTAGPATAATLAGKLGADETGLRLLADLLVSGGYLVTEAADAADTRAGTGTTADEADARAGTAADTYANSALTERWLLRDAPGSYAPVVALWQDLLFRLWDDLESTVRSGTPAVDFYAWLACNPRAHREFDAMLTGQARWLRDEVVDLVDVPAGATRLLDIGGGHATYCVGFCQRHPALTATILDLPAALDAGRTAVADAGLVDRVTLTAGDWDSSDLGTGRDLVLLFNVLHGNNPDRNADLLRRVAAALAPGGAVVVLDHVADPPPPDLAADAAAEIAFVRAFSLNLFHTQGGRLYHRAEMDDWLTAAGLRTTGWTPLTKLPSLQLTVARRPA